MEGDISGGKFGSLRGSVPSRRALISKSDGQRQKGDSHLPQGFGASYFASAGLVVFARVTVQESLHLQVCRHYGNNAKLDFLDGH